MEANELDIILQKTFQQLSSDEKLEMKDLFENEDEFNQIKFMLNSLDQLKSEDRSKPSENIKSSLDHLFHQTYQNKGVLWYNTVGTFFISNDKSWYQQNLVRIAAVLLILFLFIPFWKTNLYENKPQLSKLEQRDNNEQASTPKENISSEKEKNNGGDAFQIVKESKNQENTPIKDLKEIIVANEAAEKEHRSAGLALFESESKSLAESVSADEAPAVSIHPDGVFIGKKTSKASNFALKNHPDVLDLLTPTY